MRTSHVFLSCVAALAAGCGTTNLASVPCGEFPPCGGKVEGAWTVATSCSAPTTPQNACPGLTTDSKDVKFGGKVTFNANMTYTMTRTIEGTGRATIPKACLTAAGGSALANATCEQIAAFAGPALAAEGAPISAFVCTTNGASCDCAMTFAPRPIVQTGTFQTTGNTLVLSYRDGMNTETERWDYCADDNNLHLKPAPAAGGALDLESTLSGVLVLKK